MARERSQAVQDVIETICEKLIIRHPHIYGDVVVADEEEVKRNWEKIKLQQGKASVLSGVPVSLPALVKAGRIQEKAKQTGFDWDKREDVFDKVQEEISELQQAIADNNPVEIENEFGDVLFSLINYARFLQVDAESALEKTNKKFIDRFSRMEIKAKEKGLVLSDMSLMEMDEIWNSIKKENRTV